MEPADHEPDQHRWTRDDDVCETFSSSPVGESEYDHDA